MATRTPIIIGNWKMHHTINEAIRLVTELKGLISGKQEVEVVVAPNHVVLHSVCIALQDFNIKVAAQNMHHEEFGAFTGEVAAPMLVEAGCTHVILGHSERRRYFHETDRDIQQKFATALEHDLIPVLCVGETLEERQSNQTLAVIEQQLRVVLNGANIMSESDFLVAYEPVWAIGTGMNATVDQIREVHGMIRKTLSTVLKAETSMRIRILYGGSVNLGNIREIMSAGDVDGALVGGASLDAKQFAGIVGFLDSEEDETGLEPVGRKVIEEDEE